MERANACSFLLLQIDGNRYSFQVLLRYDSLLFVSVSLICILHAFGMNKHSNNKHKCTSASPTLMKINTNHFLYIQLQNVTVDVQNLTHIWLCSSQIAVNKFLNVGTSRSFNLQNKVMRIDVFRLHSLFIIVIAIAIIYLHKSSSLLLTESVDEEHAQEYAV